MSEKRKRGRPPASPSDLARRAVLVATICARIEKGEPLAQICRDEGMPGLSTVYDWMEADQELAGQFARARKAGFDQIALDAMQIADDGRNDILVDAEGKTRVDNDVIQRSKLRVETRLKLLAKWDPSRYGDKLQVGGAADLPPVQSSVTVDAGEAYKLLLGAKS